MSSESPHAVVVLDARVELAYVADGQKFETHLQIQMLRPDQHGLVRKGEIDPNAAPVLTALRYLEECDLPIARLARFVDPIHADMLDCSSLPRECWDTLVVCFANRSAQGVTLTQTKSTAQTFSDYDGTPLTNFLATFSGLVLDLKRAEYPLTACAPRARYALAPPTAGLDVTKGLSASNSSHWHASLSTTRNG